MSRVLEDLERCKDAIQKAKAGIIEFGPWIDNGKRTRLPVWLAWNELYMRKEKTTVDNIIRTAIERDPGLKPRSLRHGIQEFRDRGIWRSRRGRGIVLALPEPEPSEVARSLHIHALERTRCTPFFSDSEPRGFPPRVSIYALEDEKDDRLEEIVEDIRLCLDRVAGWYEARGHSPSSEAFPYVVGYSGHIPPRSH